MRIDTYLILLIFVILLELHWQKPFIAMFLIAFGGILFILNKKVSKDFKCKRCGKCCSLRVKPTKEDIKKIKKSGKKGKDFLDGKYLKRIKSKVKNKNSKSKQCIFLEFKDGHVGCSIYKNRPEICRKWPNSKGLFGKQVDIRCSQFFKIKK